MSYPVHRMRRLRRTESIRRMVGRQLVSVKSDLSMFVVSGKEIWRN